MKKHLISLDLGGTRIRSARLDSTLRILDRKETYTLAHEGLEPTLERIKEMIAAVLPEDRSTLKAIGISAPGPLNPTTGVVVSPPNLDGWNNVPLADIIRDAFDIPTYVGNDANLAALAEYTRGAAKGKGYRHVIFITHSTGIGSGIITDGKLLLGRDGLAAEFGHIPLVFEDERVSSLELEAAGPDMAMQAARRIEAGESSILREMVAGDLSKLTGGHVGRAAQQGDELALSVVRRSGRLMGLGIVTLLHLFNPEMVILGGGVSTLGDLIFDPMREAVNRYAQNPAYVKDLEIVPAALGEDVSVIGAAALAATQDEDMDAFTLARHVLDLDDE